MYPKQSGRLLTLFLLFSVFGFSAQSSDWCYDHAGKECAHTQAEWEGPCHAGKHQSPINIETKKLQHAEAGKEVLKIHFSKSWCDLNSHFYLRNSGHSVEVRLSPNMNSKDHTMSGDGLRGTYHFAQAHFHWSHLNDNGSEHTIDMKRQALSLHLVHLNDKQAAAGTSEASSNIAVLGILAHADESYPPNPVLQPILDVLSQVNGLAEDVVDDFKIPLRLFDFLPKDRTVYTYQGSLTTPPCTESVLWIIFPEPHKISVSQLEEFRKSKSRSGKSLTDNFRSTLPMNDRKVTKHKFQTNCDKEAHEREEAEKKHPHKLDSFREVTGHKLKIEP